MNYSIGFDVNMKLTGVKLNGYFNQGAAFDGANGEGQVNYET
jgi:hypothetical protein